MKRYLGDNKEKLKEYINMTITEIKAMKNTKTKSEALTKIIPFQIAMQQIRLDSYIEKLSK